MVCIMAGLSAKMKKLEEEETMKQLVHDLTH